MDGGRRSREAGCRNLAAPALSVTLPLTVGSGHQADVTGIGVERPRSGRLAMADADLPSLSHGHLVSDSAPRVSRRGESHPPALAEPDMSLALIIGGYLAFIAAVLIVS